MSDKVIVLTKRPAKVKRIYEINIKNKNLPSEVRQTSEFGYYYNLIWKELTNNEE